MARLVAAPLLMLLVEIREAATRRKARGRGGERRDGIGSQPSNTMTHLPIFAPQVWKLIYDANTGHTTERTCGHQRTTARGRSLLLTSMCGGECVGGCVGGGGGSVSSDHITEIFDGIDRGFEGS